MYKALTIILRGIIRLLYGLRVEGAENVPQTGGAIIASNHVTMVDPVPVALAVKRPIHFMAKAELFESSILDWFFRSLYAFPVKRGMADREAIRTALKIVREGHLLGIFPEGTRNPDAEALLPLQGGTALIAIKTGVPVVPVVVKGVSPLRFRRAITVQIGKPMYFGESRRATKEEVNQVSLEISKQFAEMLRRNIG
ncbi:MAG: 1-acyl-sn-glycerol-3-phosphate acyltransferase [Firmicutes bacterium]|nr:1-acyl-sn-glycerol-3-phosphate acyltransferase [Bacillota bacterium]